MYSDSVLYTVGTALNRAHDNGVDVEVLVEGQWLTGRVVAVDGHGVVLESSIPGGPAEHSVVRMGSVSAVRVFSSAPQTGHVQPLPAGATPMPMSPYERTA
jgi:hypothetical protein